MHDAYRLRFLALLALLIGLVWLDSQQGIAQSRTTATRSAEIDAFGGFNRLQSDYIPPFINYGVTLGADYTQFIKRYRGLIIPSFQLRGTIVPGNTHDEKTLQGGLKLATTYRHLHPYGALMVGQGVITFPRPAVPDPTNKYRDSSFIYNFGGGLTYDFRRDWSLLADYQHQYWDLGGHPPNRFYPQALTFGAVYHIPFKAFKTR